MPSGLFTKLQYSESVETQFSKCLTPFAMDVGVIFCANFLGFLTIRPAFIFSLVSPIPAIPVLFVTCIPQKILILFQEPFL